MGFQREAAITALGDSDNNFEEAVHRLLRAA